MRTRGHGGGTRLAEAAAAAVDAVAAAAAVAEAVAAARSRARMRRVASIPSQNGILSTNRNKGQWRTEGEGLRKEEHRHAAANLIARSRPAQHYHRRHATLT